MRIAIASGKGGTGKTTLAVNLASYLATKKDYKVNFIDCDVEEPNSHLFLKGDWSSEEKQYVPIPKIDQENCLGESCQKCAQECRFKVLIWMVDHIMVFPELCHGCGLCEYICPADAITETTREIGVLRSGSINGINFFGGLLRIGEAMAPPLISKVKDRGESQGSDIQIIDAPPGTSCPVIESLDGAEYVVVVAEPTPFGMHDLKLTVELLRKLDYQFGVVINRGGMGDDALNNYLEKEDIPLLATLPHSREAARTYSEGKLLINSLTDFEDRFAGIWENICSRTATTA